MEKCRIAFVVLSALVAVPQEATMGALAPGPTSTTGITWRVGLLPTILSLGAEYANHDYREDGDLQLPGA